MADTQKEVIIEIKTKMSDSLDSIERLKKELEELTVEQIRLNGALKNAEDDFKNGKISEEQYTKTTKALSDELEVVNSQMKVNRQQMNGYRKDIENEIKDHEAAEGSIKQMRIELSKMRKEYESMSKTDRESDAGKELLGKIAGTTDELKALEQAQGDWRREVGHYQNALENLSPILARTLNTFKAASGGTMNFVVALKNAGTAVKTFGKQLLKLAVNPVVLAIVAVVAAVKALVDQFKQTDEAMTALEQLFAAFEPILDVFRGILSVIVSILTKAISGLTSMVTAIMSLVPAFGEASEAAQNYVKAMDQLEETERRYTVETAKNNVEIARLRNKVSQSDKYSIEERRNFLNQAIELEKRNLDMELNVAKEKLRLAKEDAARRRDTSDDTMNNIAQLEAAYYQAIANSEAGMRRLYSQLSQFNQQIRKETDDTLKAVMNNSRLSASERRKASAERKENLKKQEEQVKELEQRYKNAALGLIDIDWHIAKDDYEKAKKELAEMRQEIKDDDAAMNDDILSQFLTRLNTQKQAQRDYEDAILASMDESLDKQLKLVETEYKREIEDLKQRLKYEKNLTKEAREAINNLILEKERKLQETLILTQAKYWDTVRQDARITMAEIAQMNAKMMSADPGRVGGTFAESAMEQIRTATKEFEEQSAKLTTAFAAQYSTMTGVINKALDENAKALDTFLQTEGTFVDEWADKPKVISQNVVYMMQAMRDGSQEFANGATKNLDTFMTAMDAMRKRIGMTTAEYEEMFEILKPFMTNINDYYTTLMSYPQKFTAYISNLVYNQVKSDAERIRKAILDNMDFRGLVEQDAKIIQDEIDNIDLILMNQTKDWQKILTLEPYVLGSISLTDLGLAETERDFAKIMEKLKEKFQHTLNWEFEFSEDNKAYLEIMDLGEKYGNAFNSSFSGVLEHLTGTDDLNQQMEWLVKNYESAIEQIEEINKDFQKAYTLTGDEAFKSAMIDEAAITSQMRRIYDLAKKYGKESEDWEYGRLEIQGRYIGEQDRELKVKADLLALENRRLESEKQGYENQLNYINSMRDTVREYEGFYNEVNIKNSAQISVLEQQLQALKDEAATFDEGVSPELVSANAKSIEEIEAKIQELTDMTATALKELAKTGFMSVDEIDEAAKELEKSVMTANNNIVENTAQQAATTTSIWLNSFTTVTGGMRTITSAFNSMFSEMGETNERWNAFAEATAYLTIGLSMAEGIAEAVAAGSGVPFPANLAAIASGIAAVVSGIGSAFATYNQYHSQPKFAQGGYVSGEKGVDKIPAWLSDGEYVIRRQRVKELGVGFLDELNGYKSVPGRRHFAVGGVVSSDNMAKTINSQMQMETMKEMLSEVMGEIQPVVSVREISNVQNKVRAKESIARK